MEVRALRRLVPVISLLVACNGDSTATESESDSATAGTTMATASTTQATTQSGTASESSTATTTNGGTASDSNTMGTTATTSATTMMTTSSSSGETTASTTDPTTTSTTGVDPTTTGDPTTTTGDGPCQPGDMMGMGMVEKSFLWVANTDEGSISKVDTQKVVELARYRSGPSGSTESPSRTAVSVDGRFVVVNNRGTGRVTMIAANLEDCVDKNNNGTIETSQSPANLLAWDTDECVRWSIVLPSVPNDIGAGPRAVTWTPGTWSEESCSFENPKLWVGFRPAANQSRMSKLDGLTGAVETSVEFNPWVVGDTYWGPYGAALDAQENVWFTGLRGNLYQIATKQNNMSKEWTSPFDSQFYGMTVDDKGRPWTAGCPGPVYRFDPMTQQFQAVAGMPTQECLRGIGADREGHIWAASNGACGVYQIDADTATLIQFHNLNPCSTPVGISTDDEGFVWVVDEWEGAWKIDPVNTNNKQFLPIASEHYTYSDMTGGQLKSVILPQ